MEILYYSVRIDFSIITVHGTPPTCSATRSKSCPHRDDSATDPSLPDCDLFSNCRRNTRYSQPAGRCNITTRNRH